MINHYFIRWVHNKYWTVDKPQRQCCSIHNLVTSKAKHAYNIQMFCIFIFCRMCIYNNNRFVDIDRSKPIEHSKMFYFQPHFLIIYVTSWAICLYWSLCKSTDIPAGHTLRKRVSSRCDITFTNKTFPITKHTQNQGSQLTWGNIFSTSIPNLSTIRTLAITTQNTIIFCSDLELMIRSWFSTTWIVINSNKFVDVYIVICEGLIANSSAACHRSEFTL